MPRGGWLHRGWLRREVPSGFRRPGFGRHGFRCNESARQRHRRRVGQHAAEGLRTRGRLRHWIGCCLRRPSVGSATLAIPFLRLEGQHAQEGHFKGNAHIRRVGKLPDSRQGDLIVKLHILRGNARRQRPHSFLSLIGLRPGQGFRHHLGHGQIMKYP